MSYRQRRRELLLHQYHNHTKTLEMKAAATVLVSCVASLLALGMVMLYSASMAEAGPKYLIMQLIWFGLGLVGCVSVVSLDYRYLKKIVWPLLGLAVVLLLLILVPHITRKVNGARRWF